MKTMALKNRSKYLRLLCCLYYCIFLSLPSLAVNINPRVTEETVPQFNKWFQKKGVERNFSPDNMQKLILLTEELLEETRLQIKEERFGILGAKWFERKLQFLEYASTFMKKSLDETPSLEKQHYAFTLAKGIIYMIHADEALEKRESELKKIKNIDFKVYLKTILSYLKKNQLLKIPIPSLQRPLGQDKSLKEAMWLIHPDRPKHFLSREELATMNVKEIAHLDVPEGHFSFHTKAYLDQHPDTWSEMEKGVGQRMTNFLHKKHRILDRHPQFRYDLTRAHRVVFFDDIRNGQTSAKIDVKDAFGLSWKIKWSDEIHAEVVANRLYMAIGARYVDQVYATLPGHAGSTLILHDPKAPPKAGKNECLVFTVDDFVRCLKKSRFDFNIRPFIHTSGLITKENYQHVLELLPPESKEITEPEKLIGRTFVTFKEALFEFKPKDEIHSGGPFSFSQFGLENDRALRGLLLFNAFINNNDTKEANSKGYLLMPNSSLGESGPFFTAGQHDMGKSLASALGSANPNKLTKASFIYRRNNFIRFNFLLLDLPAAWKKVTYADLLWMAERLGRLKRPQIEKIVSHTHWPDFQQKAMVYKLLQRRNQILSFFQLDSRIEENEKELTPPSHSVPLGTVEERRLAAEKYGLPFEEIQKWMGADFHKPGFEDRVLRNGRVAPCAQSPLIRLFHWHRHPTGLDRRLSRYRFITEMAPNRRPCGGLYEVEYF